MSYEEDKVLVEGKEGWRYTWPPTPPFELIVPGVSSILAMQSAPALEKWKINNAARFAVDTIPEWENLPPEEAITLIAQAAQGDFVAADFGNEIHAAIQHIMEGTEHEVQNTEALPYIAAASQFLHEHVDKVGITETTFYSEKYQYAGTPDALVKLKDGRFAIVDWKTGKIRSSMALQVAAYARADFVGKPDGTRIELDYDISTGIVVHLRPSGGYTAYYVDITDRLFGIFRALRNIQLWRDDIESNIWANKVKGKAEDKDSIWTDQTKSKQKGSTS